MGSFTKGRTKVTTAGKITLDSASNIELLDQIVVKSVTPNAVGADADGGSTAAISTNPTIYVESKNYNIVTTVLVDLTDFYSQTTDGHIIGDTANGSSNAYLTTLTSAVNGIITGADMACVKDLAGSSTNADIDVWVTTTNAGTRDAVGSETNALKIIDADGDLAQGSSIEGEFDSPTAPAIGESTYYLYLAAGAGGSGETSKYTDGHLVIQLYGWKVFE